MDELPDFDLPDLLPPLTREQVAPEAPADAPAPLPLPAPVGNPLTGHYSQGVSNPPRTEGADPGRDDYHLPDLDVPDGLGVRAEPHGAGLTETHPAGTSPAHLFHETASESPGVPQEAPECLKAPTPLPDLAGQAEGQPGALAGKGSTLGDKDARTEDALDTGESYSLDQSGDRLDRLSDSLDSLVRHLQAPRPQSAPPALRQAPPSPRNPYSGSWSH